MAIGMSHETHPVVSPAGRLEVAKSAGESEQDVDCARFAAFSWIEWEWAVLRAKLQQSPEPLWIFAQLFVMGLKAYFFCLFLDDQSNY